MTFGRTTKRRRGTRRSYLTSLARTARSTDPIVKPYKDPFDPAKLCINRTYAKYTIKILGKTARHVVLDSRYRVTSETMVEHGVPKENIWAPNINKYDCDQLTQYGVSAPHTTIENCLLDVSIGPRAMWYDSMTTIGGRKDLGHYPGVVIDRFLAQNKTLGKSCVLAVTLAKRNNQEDCEYESQKSTIMKQLKRLVQLRGFVIRTQKVSEYKASMIFAMYHLIYDPTSAMGKHCKLLMWKDGRDQIIGFPAGYVL